MKRHIRFMAVMLALTLLVTLTSCWLLEEPFGDEGATETATDILWDPLKTAPDETYVFPDIPDETAPATRLESDTLDMPAVPDIRTLYGTVVTYPEEIPMEHVMAVEVYMDGKRQTVFVYVDDPSMDFCVGDMVEFSYDALEEVVFLFDGIPVLSALTIDYVPVEVPEKPVIYLYPETPTEVSVKLTLDGKLTCTYPSYDKGWDDFTAHPDGTLIFPDGKQYYCLYWEGIQSMVCDFTRGFCVKGSDTAAFLEWALAEQGLTPREANEFIIYWLPRMEGNPYNVISFQTEAYTEGAVLDIQPNPDSLLRVFMAWYPSEVAVELEAQSFTPFERTGFAVVEWGGSELKKN